jgi:hypothetical protein
VAKKIWKELLVDVGESQSKILVQSDVFCILFVKGLLIKTSSIRFNSGV